MAAKADLKMRSKAAAKRQGARAKTAQGAHSFRAFRALSVGLLLFAVLGLLESIFWLGSVARELAPWSLLASAACGATALLLRLRVLAAVHLLTFLLTALPLWPLYRWTKPTPAGGPVLHVASATFAETAPSPAAVARFVATRSLDVLALVRVPQADLPALDRALVLKRVVTAGPPAARRVIYARAPQSKFSVAAGREDTRRVRVGHCDVELSVLDLPSLLDPVHGRDRAEALTDLPRASRTGLAIWLGHFGGRADAADLRQQEALPSLRDTREGHGFLATAPATLGAFGRSVDQALVQGWVAVRARDVAEPLAEGAHRSVTATLEFTDKRCR